jgi:hypothetical protein
MRGSTERRLRLPVVVTTDPIGRENADAIDIMFPLSGGDFALSGRRKKRRSKRNSGKSSVKNASKDASASSKRKKLRKEKEAERRRKGESDTESDDNDDEDTKREKRRKKRLKKKGKDENDENDDSDDTDTDDDNRSPQDKMRDRMKTARKKTADDQAKKDLTGDTSGLPQKKKPDDDDDESKKNAKGALMGKDADKLKKRGDDDESKKKDDSDDDESKKRGDSEDDDESKKKARDSLTGDTDKLKKDQDDRKKQEEAEKEAENTLTGGADKLKKDQDDRKKQEEAEKEAENTLTGGADKLKKDQDDRKKQEEAEKEAEKGGDGDPKKDEEEDPNKGDDDEDPTNKSVGEGPKEEGDDDPEKDGDSDPKNDDEKDSDGFESYSDDDGEDPDKMTKREKLDKADDIIGGVGDITDTLEDPLNTGTDALAQGTTGLIENAGNDEDDGPSIDPTEGELSTRVDELKEGDAPSDPEEVATPSEDSPDQDKPPDTKKNDSGSNTGTETESGDSEDSDDDDSDDGSGGGGGSDRTTELGGVQLGGGGGGGGGFDGGGGGDGGDGVEAPTEPEDSGDGDEPEDKPSRIDNILSAVNGVKNGAQKGIAKFGTFVEATKGALQTGYSSINALADAAGIDIDLKDIGLAVVLEVGEAMGMEQEDLAILAVVYDLATDALLTPKQAEVRDRVVDEHVKNEAVDMAKELYAKDGVDFDEIVIVYINAAVSSGDLDADLAARLIDDIWRESFIESMDLDEDEEDDPDLGALTAIIEAAVEDGSIDADRATRIIAMVEDKTDLSDEDAEILDTIEILVAEEAIESNNPDVEEVGGRGVKWGTPDEEEPEEEIPEEIAEADEDEEKIPEEIVAADEDEEEDPTPVDIPVVVEDVEAPADPPALDSSFMTDDFAFTFRDWARVHRMANQIRLELSGGANKKKKAAAKEFDIRDTKDGDAAAAEDSLSEDEQADAEKSLLSADGSVGSDDEAGSEPELMSEEEGGGGSEGSFDAYDTETQAIEIATKVVDAKNLAQEIKDDFGARLVKDKAENAVKKLEEITGAGTAQIDKRWQETQDDRFTRIMKALDQEGTNLEINRRVSEKDERLRLKVEQIKRGDALAAEEAKARDDMIFGENTEEDAENAKMANAKRKKLGLMDGIVRTSTDPVESDYVNPFEKRATPVPAPET